MKINLAKLTESREKVIASESDIFAEYPKLHNSGFEITIKRLGRSENIDIVTSLGENATAGERSKAVFINSITDVKGIEDEETGNEITIENGIRELIWDYESDLASVLDAEMVKLTKGEEEKKSEVEQDLEPTQIG